MNEIKQITEKIKKFRDDRDWAQFHNHKDMALSLMLEAGELLEHFQWKSTEQALEHAISHRDEIADELADIAIYLFELSDNLNIDLTKSIEKKLLKNEQKYPVKKARGSSKKYNEL